MRLFIPMLFFFILCSFLIHILFFTTPTPFSISCLAFFLFFILFPFRFFIQCPSPYSPHPHTKHAAIAKRKMNKKKSPPHTTMHTHTTMPPPSLLLQPTCVQCICLAVLGVYLPCTCLQQPGCSNTPKNKNKTKIHSDECTAWHT